MNSSSLPPVPSTADDAPPTLAHRISFEHLPQWFIAGFAIVYLSGYLIDFHYSSILGISENGGDLLKLKYTQIGLSFIVFFLILAGPSLLEIVGFLGVIFDRHLDTDERKRRSTRFAVAFFTILYTVSIYSAFLFTPAHYFQQDPRRIYSIVFLIFFVQVIYIAVTSVLEKYQKQYAASVTSFSTERPPGKRWKLKLGEHNWIARIILCCALVALTVYCDYRAFKGLLPTMYECLVDRRGFIFFIICILFGVLISRAIVRSNHPPMHSAQYAILMGTSLLVIFYLGIVSYAYSIFSYIPSVKGGADFTNAPMVSITFDREKDGTQREDLVNAIEVYNNSTSVYLAIPHTRSDVCAWRRGAAFPRLIQIERTAIWKIDVVPEQPEAQTFCRRHSQR